MTRTYPLGRMRCENAAEKCVLISAEDGERDGGLWSCEKGMMAAIRLASADGWQCFIRISPSTSRKLLDGRVSSVSIVETLLDIVSQSFRFPGFFVFQIDELITTHRQYAYSA